MLIKLISTIISIAIINRFNIGLLKIIITISFIDVDDDNNTG